MSQSMRNLHTLNLSTTNRARHLSLNGFPKNLTSYGDAESLNKIVQAIGVAMAFSILARPSLHISQKFRSLHEICRLESSEM